MVRISIRFDLDNGERLGPGKADLLTLVERHGSIRAAGAAMNMSYRRAWLLVDTMNRMFARPLVETAHGGAKGGGARLTDEGREVLALYRTMEQRFRESCAPEVEALDARASPAARIRQRA